METFIALLRGINVSGQKKIKMADLRTQLEPLGFKQIQTYIQSGNIVFQSAITDPQQLARKIEQRIKEVYDFEVPTLILSPNTLQQILNDNPFTAEDPSVDTKQLYFTLLNASPAKEPLAKLASFQFSNERFQVIDHVIYCHYEQGYGRSKMNNTFFEKQLKVRATTRNWRTMNKLLEMGINLEE